MIQKNTILDNWDQFSVSHKKVDPVAYYTAYLSFQELVDKLPKRELIKNGWLSGDDFLSSLVPLFNNVVNDKFKTLFRKNATANDALYALWLSKISEIAKEKILTTDIHEFQRLTKEDLKEIAHYSIDESLIKELPQILAHYGIVLIYEKSIPGMKLDGVVLKLISGHPVIGISLRYPRIDHFWFTLLHELSHIVLHFEQLDNPIFDDLEQESSELIEKQANRLAKSSFVERSIWRNCEPKYQIGDNAVFRFAKKVNIHPAIIAGLLRYEKNNYEIYNNIIHKTDVRKLVFGNE